MKFVSWNINGLRSVFKKGFAKTLKKLRADVICLQEIKIQESQLSLEVDPPKNYQAYYSFAEKKGYSGVAALINGNCLKRKPKISIGIGEPKFDSEGRFVIWRHRDFWLYNIYFPSGSSGELRQAYKYEFLDALYRHIESLSASTRKKLIICGDYNICHKPIDIHHPEVAAKRELSGFLPEERAWMDAFSELGLIDTYRLLHGDKASQYTWWSYRADSRNKNLGWRIDYFFVSRALKNKIRNAKILPKVLGSDHCPVVLEMEF